MTYPSQFSVDTLADGFLIRYWNASAKEPGTNPGPALTIRIQDNRSMLARQTDIKRENREPRPIPASWIFLPAQELEIFGTPAQQAALQKEVEADLGTAVAPLSDTALKLRDFDVIIVYAAPGISVSVSPSKAIEKFRGSKNEFDVGRPPIGLPLVEVIRLQDDERIPPPGMDSGAQLLMAPYFITSFGDLVFDPQEGHDANAAQIASLILDFDNTEDDPVIEGPVALDQRVDQGRTEYNQNIYLHTVFSHVNEYFGLRAPNDVAVIPTPDGVLVRHLASLVDLRIVVPLIAADPRFVMRKAGSIFNDRAKFAFKINSDAYDALIWENLSEQIDLGELITGGSVEDRSPTIGPRVDAWVLTHGQEDHRPLIEVVKTPSVDVTIGAPLLNSLMQVITEEHLGQVWPPLWRSDPFQHIEDLGLVQVYDVDSVDKVPEQGSDFDPEKIGARPISMTRKRSFDFLDEEMQVDLLDGAVRSMLGPFGDAIDVLELAYALYEDRDFYGRKVSTTQKLMMALAVLPLVNRGMLKAVAKGGRMSKVIGAVDVGTTGFATGLTASQLYQLSDAVKQDEARQLLESEFVFHAAQE